MSRESVLKNKSFDFSVRVVRLYQYLIVSKQEFVISKQVLRSGTSIGALICEAEHAESRKDFLHKLSISLKEANECIYWLELLYHTSFINKKMFDSISNDCKSLLKMLISSIKTIKERG